MAHRTGFLFLLLILSAAKGAYYVQTGKDEHFCGFKCYQPYGILQLRCNDTNQLLVECSNSSLKIHHLINQRISLNKISGCWMLRDAHKNDTGSYKIWFYKGSEKLLLESIDITVLDAVKIQHILRRRSRDGADVSLTVLFSGGRATVFWELDGGSLPARYSLQDDNRTLWIEDVREQDEKSVLAVWVKNPVSEDMQECHLENKDERKQFSRNRAGILVSASWFFPFVFVVIAVLYFRSE